MSYQYFTKYSYSLLLIFFHTFSILFFFQFLSINVSQRQDKQQMKYDRYGCVTILEGIPA